MVRERNNKQITAFLLLSCALVFFKTVEAQCSDILDIKDYSNLAPSYTYQLGSGLKTIPFELKVICDTDPPFQTHDGYPLTYSVLDTSVPAVNLLSETWMTIESDSGGPQAKLKIDTSDSGLVSAGPQVFEVAKIVTTEMSPPGCNIFMGGCQIIIGQTTSFRLYFEASGCNTATVDSFSLNSMTTTVGDTPAITQAIPALSTDAETADSSLDCGERKYTLTSLDTPAVDLTPFLSVETSPTLQISLLSTQISEISNIYYGVRLTVSLTNFPTATASSASAKIFILDPCPGTTLQATDVADMTETARDGTATTQNVILKDSVSLNYDAGGEGYLTCGPQSYSLTIPAALVGVLSISGNTISVDSSSLADCSGSPYTITLRSSILGGSLYLDETFKVTIIDICDSAVIDAQHQTIIEYANDGSPTTLTMVFTDSVGVAKSNANFCGDKTFSVNGYTSQSWFSYSVSNPQTITMTVEEPNIANIGTYSWTLQVGFVSFSASRTNSLIIRIRHPCHNTTLNATGVSNMSIMVLHNSMATQDVLMTDSESTSRDPNGQGYIFCGGRTYTLVNAPSCLTIVGNQIRLQSTSATDIDNSPYSVTLESTLDSGLGSPSTKSESFTVTILPCPITSVVASPASLGPYTYVFDDNQVNVNYPTFAITPDCLWTPSWSMNTVPSPEYTIITTNAADFYYETDTLALKGQSFTVTMVATFPDSNAFSTNFPIDFNVVDPCPNTFFDNDDVGVCPNISITVNGGSVTRTLNPNLWIDEESDNRYNGDGYTLCGPRVLTIDSAYTTHSWASTNTASYQYSASATSTQDPSGEEGTSQNFSCTMCLQDYPTICHSQTFTVTIAECVPAPHQKPAGSYTSKTYRMFYDATLTISKPLFEQAPCNFVQTVTCTINGSAIPNTWITESASSLVVNTEDQSLHGSYSIVCTSTLQSNPQMTKSATFTLNMIDPCKTSQFIAPYYEPADLSVAVQGTPVGNSWTDAQYQDTVNSEIGIQKGLGSNDQSTCGPKEYIFNEISEARHSKPTATSLQLAPTTQSEVGSHMCSLTVQLVNYGSTSTCRMTQTFQCYVLPCTIVTLTQTNPIADQYYILADVSLTINFPFATYVQSPNCGATGTITDQTAGAGLPTGMTIDPSTAYTVQTNDLTQVGTYTITYRVTFNDASNKQMDLSFQIEYDNPCDGTITNTNTLTSMGATDMTTTILLGSAVTQDITTKDWASTNFGNKDGVSLCGTREYKIMSGSGAWVSQTTTSATDDTISFQTNDFGLTPITSSTAYPLQMRVCLDNYSSVDVACIFYNIDLIVEPCKIVTYTPDSTISTQTYDIWLDSVSPFTVAYPTFTQVPACQYTPTISTTVDAAALSAVTHPYLTEQNGASQYDVFSQDNTHAGTYNVIHTRTLNDFYHVAAGTVNSDTAWDLVLIDSCTFCTVNSNLFDASQEYTMLDMMTTVNLGTSVTQTFVSFQDSLSQRFGATYLAGDPLQGTDLCGPRTYTFTIDSLPSSNYAWFSFDITSGTISIQTANDSDVKYTPQGYSVTVQACLDNYAPCSPTQTFEINIEECRLTGFAISTSQLGQTYKIFDTQNVHPVEAYIQTPLCGYTLNFQCAIVGNGALSYVNYDCTDRPIPSTGQPLGMDTQTDPVNPKYKIESNEHALAGTYSVTQTINIPGYRYTADGLDVISDNWTLFLEDPCFSSVIESQASVFAPDPLIETSVKLGTDTLLPYSDANIGTETKFSFSHFGDTESTTYTQPGDPLVCRARSYQIEIIDHQLQPGDPVVPYVAPTSGETFIYFDQTLLELNVHTNLDQFIGYYTVKLSIWLAFYPFVNDVQNFKVRIWPCLVNQLLLDAPLTTDNPFIFNLYQPQVTIPFQPYTQVPLCGYTYTYSISLTNGNPLPSFANIGLCGTDPCQITFQSNSRFDDLCEYGEDDDNDASTPKINQNICLAGKENPYPFLLTATLAPSVSSPYFHPNQASVLTTNTQGTLNVWPKDICMDASLIVYDPDSQDETKNMYSFIYEPLWNKYEFETTLDSISLDSVNNVVDGSGHDLCGPRFYFIESAGGAPLAYAKVDQTDEPPVVEYQTNQWNMKGLRGVNFRTQLAWYPHLEETIVLMVSFYGLYETKTPDKQYHQIGGEVTEFQFLPFSIDPKDGRWGIDYQIEYKRESASTFNPAPSWIVFDPLSNKVLIATTNLAYEGNWHLRIKGMIREHPSNTAYGANILLILSKDAPPVSITNPPYFADQIKDKFSYQYDELKTWEYALPDMRDPENDIVTCNMVLLPTFIIYDKTDHKLTLIPNIVDEKDIGDHPIQFNLVDASGALSETYEILFQITDKPVVSDPSDYEGKYIPPGERKPPVPQIKTINRKGRVQVVWNMPMRRPRNIDKIKEETCEWTNPETEEIEVKPAIEVAVLRGAYSQTVNTDFDWEIQNWQDKSFEIQLNFKEPLVITTFVDPEKLLVVFYCEDLFRDKFRNIKIKGGPNIRTDSVLFDNIPEQIEILTKEQEKMQEQVQGTAQVFNLINFVANLLLSASLNQLWSMINTQQIIVLIPLFNLKAPLNANMFFTVIMQIAAFDIIPTDDVYAIVFGLEDMDMPEALTENFETVGFETIWSIFNLGSLGLAVLSFPFFVCVDMVLKIFSKFEKVRRWRQTLDKKLYWNTSLRILTESYTIMTVCCLINLTDLTWGSYGEICMSSFAIVGTGVVTLFPFVSSAILYFNWAKIESGDKEFEERFGALWEGIDTSKGKQVIWYQHQFLLRRLIIGTAVVVSREILIFQLIQLVMQCVSGVIVIGQFLPMENPKTNKQEFFNEAMILVVTYTFFCFSPWGPDDEYYREKLGQVAIAGVAFHIGFNLFQMGSDTVRITRLKTTRWYLSRKYAKIRSEKIYAFEKKMRHKKFKQEKLERRKQWLQNDEIKKRNALMVNIKRFGDIYTKDLSRAPKPEGVDFSSRETRSRMPNVPPPLDLRPKLKPVKKSKLIDFDPSQDIVLPKKKTDNQILPQKFDFQGEPSPRISLGSNQSASSESISDSQISSKLSKTNSRTTKLSSLLKDQQSYKNRLPQSQHDNLSIKDFSIKSTKTAPNLITEEKKPQQNDILEIEDSNQLFEDSFFDEGMEKFRLDQNEGSLGNDTEIQFGTNMRNTLQTEDDLIPQINVEDGGGEEAMKDMLDGLSDMAFSQDGEEYKKYKLFHN